MADGVERHAATLIEPHRLAIGYEERAVGQHLHVVVDELRNLPHDVRAPIDQRERLPDAHREQATVIEQLGVLPVSFPRKTPRVHPVAGEVDEVGLVDVVGVEVVAWAGARGVMARHSLERDRGVFVPLHVSEGAKVLESLLLGGARLLGLGVGTR